MNKTLNKILVVLYGVIGRSIKYTYLNHKEKIFKKLKKENISFDVCVVNNNIQTTKIDGYLINNDDYKMVDYDFYIEETQKIIDKKRNQVSGEIVLSLYKGNITILSRKTKNKAYSMKKVSFEENKTFNKKKVENFIKFHSKQLNKG